jgi:hypothetical protein
MCFFIAACNGNVRPKKPDNLISKDKMSEVLYDLYVINAAKGVNRKLLETKGFIPETYVLTKHNIDSLQFAESNVYYAFDTETYQDILEQVKLRLQKEKAKYEAVQKAVDKATEIRRDSINKIKTKQRDSIKGI